MPNATAVPTFPCSTARELAFLRFVAEARRAGVRHGITDLPDSAQFARAVRQVDLEMCEALVFEATTVQDVVRSFGIAIPAAMGNDIGGVSGVEAGTLVPGSKELLVLSIGPGGGKRYSYVVHEESGITRIAWHSERPHTRGDMLAVVDDPAWCVRWTEYRDGQPTSYTVADAGGVHTYTLAQERAHTAPWPGRAESPLYAAAILSLFGVAEHGPWRSTRTPSEPAPPSPPAAAVIEPAAPATLGDLRAKFGK